MIGRATAALHPGSRPGRWFRRSWGLLDIHARQKWAAVWPRLSRLPHRGIRVLDAGCARGDWALEIATRRPGWTVIGVDRDPRAIADADASKVRIDRPNVSFMTTDFLDYAPSEPFDIVLSIASAHYLAEAGAGQALFDRFKSWLKPGGRLILYGPRVGAAVLRVRGLPSLTVRSVFDREELTGYCEHAGLRVESLDGAIGRLGGLAKQFRVWSSVGLIRRVWTYPVAWSLSWLDARSWIGHRIGTYAWVLIARA